MRLYVIALFCLQLPTIPTQAQWDLEDSRTTANLRGIVNVGGGVAWASGTNGTVLRTEDGGYLWRTCTTPSGGEHLDFRGIQAFDASTAIVMSSGRGDLSRLYKTTDGCQTWKLLFTNPDKDGFWDALYFDHDHQSGWILGDPVKRQFTIFSSDNAGRTWMRQRNAGLKARAEGQGAFAASNSSVCESNGGIEFGTGGSEGAYLYLTTDTEIVLSDPSSGATKFEHQIGWERNEVPVGNHSESSGVFSLAKRWNLMTIPPREVKIAIGGDYLRPDDSAANAAWTDDRGKTWHVSQTAPHGFRSAVAYDADSKTWIAVGPNGTDVSSDDGRNWRALHPNAALHDAPDADRNWNALSLPFVVGPDGRIGKLRDHVLKH